MYVIRLSDGRYVSDAEVLICGTKAAGELKASPDVAKALLYADIEDARAFAHVAMHGKVTYVIERAPSALAFS